MNLLIITPTLGKSPWIDEAVESVARFAPAARQVLVAPAGAVDELALRFSQVTVVAETDRGMYAAINHAAVVAPEWEWMTYLNDDDRLGPGMDRLIRAAAQGSADILYGRVNYIDEQSRDLGPFPVEPRPRRFASLMAAGIPPLTQQGTLVSRTCFKRLRGFDPRYRLAADHDFWVRAVVTGCAFRHFPTRVGSFRLRSDQLSSDQNKVRAELASIQVRHFASGNRWTDCFVRTMFRCRHASAIVARRRRTGRWRTGGLAWRSAE